MELNLADALATERPRNNFGKELALLNEDQKDYMAAIAKLSPEQRCQCGWFKLGECPHCVSGKTLADRLSESKIECEKVGKERKMYGENEDMSNTVQKLSEYEDSARREVNEQKMELPKALKPETEYPKNEPMLQFFEYAHLNFELQLISQPFCILASKMVNILPRNPERTVMLRKLLEAKDCAVRSQLCKG